MNTDRLFDKTLRTLLRPVVPYLDDPSVSEIMINGPEHVFIERSGKLERVPVRFESADSVLAALRNVAQFAGSFIDAQRPVLEARLPDGSRLEALIAPIVENGPSVAIRRFSHAKLTLPQLVELGALSEEAAAALVAMSNAKCNIIVSGGTGSGKTSLLNVLASAVPVSERVLVLEDTREIQVDRDHVVYLTSRKPDERGELEVSIRDLFRASLRMRPDRIIVGELRGAEALELVQATVSGHGGCLSTLHASSPHDAMTRLETMCLMSDLAMPLHAIRNQLASGIEVIVQVSRLPDGRRGVTHISEVIGLSDTGQHYRLHDLFVREHGACASSRLMATGIAPRCAGKLAEHGLTFPASMLRRVTQPREVEHGPQAQ
jgi:pilus assembly protein CpaF